MSISQTTLASLLPLVLGGVVSYFKPFLEDQKDFKNRCTRIITLSTEKIARALNRLVDAEFEFRSKGYDNMPRGDGYKTPDLYDETASAIAKHAKLSFRVSARVEMFRICYLLLLVGVVIGILGLLSSFLLVGHETVVAEACLATAVVQVGSVVVLYVLTRRSEDDEEIL